LQQACHDLRVDTVLRVSRDHAATEAWALTLASMGVSCRIEAIDETWAIVVAEADAARGREALDAYDAENRPAETPAPVEYGATWLGPAVALGLCAFFFVTGERGEQGWFVLGSAEASALRAGQWWRTVTALTLHADLAHVMSNAFASFIVAAALGRALGPGVAAWLLLAGGAAGNALTAWAYGAAHSSVGASTAVFAGVGALVALAARHRARWSRGTAWVAVAAGLALFGVLGTSKGTDVLAHAFGLLAGGALGLGALFPARPFGRPLQAALWLSALAAVIGCWVVALRH
jgi:membrane associated rhomboid family serine protease